MITIPPKKKTLKATWKHNTKITPTKNNDILDCKHAPANNLKNNRAEEQRERKWQTATLPLK